MRIEFFIGLGLVTERVADHELLRLKRYEVVGEERVVLLDVEVVQFEQALDQGLVGQAEVAQRLAVLSILVDLVSDLIVGDDDLLDEDFVETLQLGSSLGLLSDGMESVVDLLVVF